MVPQSAQFSTGSKANQGHTARPGTGDAVKRRIRVDPTAEAVCLGTTACPHNVASETIRHSCEPLLRPIPCLPPKEERKYKPKSDRTTYRMKKVNKGSDR